MRVEKINNNLNLKGSFLCNDCIIESINKANRKEITRFSNLLERMKKVNDFKRIAIFEETDKYIPESNTKTFVLVDMIQNKNIDIFHIKNKTKSIYSKLLKTINDNLEKLYPKIKKCDISTQEYMDRIKENLTYNTEHKGYFND